MKIAVFVEDHITPENGGGYSYSERIIQGLSGLSAEGEVVYCPLYRNARDTYSNSNAICENAVFLELDRLRFRYPLWLRMLWLASHKGPFRFASWAAFSKTKKAEETRRHIQQVVSQNRIDIIYYVYQHSCLTPEVPFVITNWDVGHLSQPGFPEFTSKEQFAKRDAWYRETLPRAVCVFAESQAGRNELKHYVQLSDKKIKIVPLVPGKVIELALDGRDQPRVLSELHLQREQFFFYPAQFWTHKNHYTLLVAFKRMREKTGQDIRLVLTGSDKGNLLYVKETVNRLGLKKAVSFPGFVSDEMLYVLYKNSLALVMPTFLGPTNMPIIEAMALGCPVICSDLTGHREIAGDAALFFDPGDETRLSEHLCSVASTSALRARLGRSGNERYRASDFQYEKALQAIHRNFREIKKIRRCWGHGEYSQK